MTQEERFKEAKKLYETANADQRCVLETLYPELKESEDEKIRKWIIDDIRYNMNNEPLINSEYKKKAEKAIAWLEKQGEQKPDDKAEPKFHKGEWIIHQGTENIYQVVAVIDNQYQLKYGDNYTIQYCEDVDRCARLWTIQDAKDGDVLVSSDASYIVIFGGLSYLEDNIDRFKSYCHYSKGIFSPIEDPSWCCNAFHPATKEQREQFEKAMTDAGYTFDFEKKVLKKIEQKPAWSEEDEKLQSKLIRWQEEWLSSQKNGGYMDNENLIKSIEESISWLHHIKDRVQPQPKQEWSEEDERMYRGIHNLIYSTPYCNSRKEFSDWLESLKGLVQPKQEWKQENTGELTDFENAMMHIGDSFFGQHAGLDPNDTNTIKEQANLLLELAPKQKIRCGS